MKKNITLFKIGIILGLIPLLIGCLIFLAWWISVDFFADDNDELAETGFIWIIISIPVALTGLAFQISFLINDMRKHVFKFIIGCLIILFNIPVLLLIIISYEAISDRTYLKIKNNSGKHLSNVMIEEPAHKSKLGNIETENYKVEYLNTLEWKYTRDKDKRKPEIYLRFISDGQFIKRKLPIARPYGIQTITIDENFNLKNNKDYNSRRRVKRSQKE